MRPNNNPNYFKGKKSKFYKNYKKENTNSSINTEAYNNRGNNFNMQNNNEVTNLYNSVYDPEKDKNFKKILCVIQKGTSNNKQIGVSYIEPCDTHLDSSSTIYSGDYSLYELDSFELFLSNLQPDLIFLHCPSDSKLKEMFKFFENKVRFLPCIYIQYIEIKNILYFYFNNILDDEENDVRINTKIAKVLDTLSESSYPAFYSILMIALKSNLNESDQLSYLNFEKILFEEILFVSKKTQRELKIFEEKLHPSLVKGIGRSKEGLSLFALFNKCITSQGKKLMKNLFSFPSKNYQKINQRLDCISDFLSLKNQSIVKLLLNEMKNIKDLDKIIAELNKFMINYKIWNGLFYSFESILKIFELFKNHFVNIDRTNTSKGFKLLSNIFNRIDQENILKVYNFVMSCLDFMKDELRPKIKIGVNQDLDTLRKEYNELDEILSKYAIDYQKKIPKNSFMEKFMFVFLPQLGYMFAVEKSEKYYKFLRKVNAMIEDGEEGKIDMNAVIDNMNIKVGAKSERKDSDDEEEEEEKNKNSHLLNNNQNSNEILNSNKSDHGEDEIIVENSGHSSESKINRDNKLDKRLIYSLSMIDENQNLLTFQTNEEFLNKHKKTPNLLNNEDDYNIIKEDTDEDESEGDESFIDGNNLQENYEFQNNDETFLLQKLTFEDINIKFQFHTDNMIYFKNEMTGILDDQFGDLSAKITDIENAIFREISKQIKNYEKDIQITNEFIANLDVFLHLYIMTEKLNLYRPITNLESKEDGMIELDSKGSNFSFVDGRNLITELVNDRKYIKNSFNSNEKSIFIITGNISSGKSVFIRKIGMLAYLAQIGSYVPARNLDLTIFDRILSNIEIIESSLDNLSGFTVELKEIKTILDILSRIKVKSENEDSAHSKKQLGNTLVILDDPYKRTSSHNKNCLLGGTVSFLNGLIKNEDMKAKIFISTTIESRDFLIENGIIDEGITGLYEMKTQIVNENSKENDLSILNFYELKEVSYSSLRKSNENKIILNEGNIIIQNNNMNLFLAKENGLDNEIFLRAIEISNVLGMKKKIFPELTNIVKIVENLKNQGHYFKLLNENNLQVSEILVRLNAIIDN